jgi:SAM-dependent methyltransferase
VDLAERAGQIDWYHTLELAPGVVTPGLFDLRDIVGRYGLPGDMTGMRALDVGTWDGFWAFEMERRGARVTAIDIDDQRDLDWPANRRPDSFPDTPRGAGFHLAKEALGSGVERVNRSIYDAFPEDLGTFDVVFCGSVLMHLRDQVLALERIAGLCSGTFISAEEYSRMLSLVPMSLSRFRAPREASVVFWEPNVRTWRRMMETAAFDEVKEIGRFKMTAREGWSVHHVVHHCRKGGDTG